MPVADFSIAIVSPQRDRLGEGPHWDHVRGELIHVDILEGRVFGWNVETGAAWHIEHRGEVSAAIPRRNGGLVLACGHDLIARDSTGGERVLASVPPDDHTRLNDCRCDPRGRLWAGTMSRERRAGTAALYRLGSDNALEAVVTETTISNGLGWSPDGERMYFTDSTTQRIDVFDYDLERGDASDRRPFALVDPEAGLPDGLTVDADGCVWVCVFGGGVVRCYSPSGELEREVPLPVTNPTCPVFGGPDLATIYVTSAQHRLTRAQIDAEPAGALLAVRVGARGLPSYPFAA